METPPIVQGMNPSTTINFFYSGLREVIGERIVSQDEILHVSSVLASFALTSCEASPTIAPLRALSELSQKTDFGPEAIFAHEIGKIASAQCLFLNGFFRDQMRREHNLGLYDQLGSSFYLLARESAEGPRQRALFDEMSRKFTLWARYCCALHRTLRKNQVHYRMH